MNALHRSPMRRQGVRRAVVLLPNGLTLFNLFCGIYAIILAIRGEFSAAPAFIVLGGIADTLDGRVARATGTGSKFGEELDSLVDAVSFGFAPALIMYLGQPDHGTLEWLLVFMFTACAVMRLARFNVEQAGRSKTHFHGLPSPAAGLTLATYYWFSQTPLYNKAVILFTDSKTLSDLPWPALMRWLMAILAALMISEVPYPTVPSIGFRNLRQIVGTIVVSGCVVLLLVRREEFIFPALLAYVVFGVVKWFVLGLVGRSSTPDEIFWEEDDEDDEARDQRRAALGRQTGVAAAMPGIAESRRELQREERRLDERRPSDDTQAARRKRRRRSHRGPRPSGSSSPDLTLPPPSPDTPTGSSE